MMVVALFCFYQLIPVSASHHVRSSHVIGDLSLNDVIFTNNLLFDVSVRSPLECAQKCSNTETCASLTYHKTSTTSSGDHKDVMTSCRGHKNVLTSNSSRVPAIGTRAFILRETPLRTLLLLTSSGGFQPPVYRPSNQSYRVDLASGLCYRVYDVIADYVTARNTCVAEGASLVTLDTDEKLRPFYTDLLKDTQVAEYYVGATRPLNQWNDTWDSDSDYFVWTRTGASLRPLARHFAPGFPKFRPEFNCVALLFIQVWTQWGTFGVLKDGNCTLGRKFVCEKTCSL